MLGPEAGPAVAETISEAGVAAVAFLDDRKSERISRTLIEISDEAATRIVAGEEIRMEIADPESDDATALFEAVIEAAAQSVGELRARADRADMALVEDYRPGQDERRPLRVGVPLRARRIARCGG